jgi:hypothetical protein
MTDGEEQASESDSAQEQSPSEESGTTEPGATEEPWLARPAKMEALNFSDEPEGLEFAEDHADDSEP